MIHYKQNEFLIIKYYVNYVGIFSEKVDFLDPELIEDPTLVAGTFYRIIEEIPYKIPIVKSIDSD